MLKHVNEVKTPPRHHLDESALEEMQSNVQVQRTSSAVFPFGFLGLGFLHC